MRSTSRSKCVRSFGVDPGALRRVEQDVEGLVEGDARLLEVAQGQLVLAEREEPVGLGDQRHRRGRRAARAPERCAPRPAASTGCGRGRDLRGRVAAACRRVAGGLQRAARTFVASGRSPAGPCSTSVRATGGWLVPGGARAGQVFPAGRNLRTKLGSGRPDRNPKPWIEIRPFGGPAEGSTPRGAGSRQPRDDRTRATTPMKTSCVSPSSRAAGVTMARGARRMRRPARSACRTSSSHTKSTAGPAFSTSTGGGGGGRDGSPSRAARRERRRCRRDATRRRAVPTHRDRPRPC